MGNLATEEILKKLGEEDKSGKAKKNQKSNVVFKDGSKNPKNSGNGKKSKEKRNQLEKDFAKNSGASSNSPSPSPKHSVKANGRILPVMSAKTIEGETAELLRERKEKISERKSRLSENPGDSAKGASSLTVVPSGEDDDEEQYVSADEFVNSAASDEVYHTDEVSSSHDLMNDAGNFRADDEEVIPNKSNVEEPEFIQVIPKNRKKILNGLTVDKKGFTGSNVEKSSSSRQVLPYVEGSNQRRNSAQLTIETGSGHSNQQTSPNDHSKFSGPLGRRQLNSLADYIENSTVYQGKNRKNSHHGNSKTSGNAFQRPKSSVSHDYTKSKSTDVTDRRGSQSSGPSGRYAAAVIHNNQSVGTFPAVTTIGARPSSPQSQLVSPVLSSASSSTNSSKPKKTSVTTYDPSDERANPPLPSPGTSTVVADMTNTACVTATASSTSSSGTRSYAEIAKRKSPVMASCANDHPFRTSPRDTSPEVCTASTSTTNDDRCTSVTSSAGGSVEIIDKDGVGPSSGVRQPDTDTVESTGVDGFSFFYDPNEPATIYNASPLTSDENELDCNFFSPSTPTATKLDESSKRTMKSEARSEKEVIKTEKPVGRPLKSESKRTKQAVELKSGKVEKSEKQKSVEASINNRNSISVSLNVPNGDSLPSETRSSIVLKLESGKTFVLPSMNPGGATEVDRKKKEMMDNAWKNFMESGPVPVRYTPGVLHCNSTGKTKKE